MRIIPILFLLFSSYIANAACEFTHEVFDCVVNIYCDGELTASIPACGIYATKGGNNVNISNGNVNAVIDIRNFDATYEDLLAELAGLTVTCCPGGMPMEPIVNICDTCGIQPSDTLNVSLINDSVQVYGQLDVSIVMPDTFDVNIVEGLDVLEEKLCEILEQDSVYQEQDEILQDSILSTLIEWCEADDEFQDELLGNDSLQLICLDSLKSLILETNDLLEESITQDSSYYDSQLALDSSILDKLCSIDSTLEDSAADSILQAWCEADSAFMEEALENDSLLLECLDSLKKLLNDTLAIDFEQIDIEHVPYCIDDTIQGYAPITYVDGVATEPSLPEGAVLGECPALEKECYAVKRFFAGIENTGTRFNGAYEITNTNADGTITIVNVDATASWGAMMIEWESKYAAAYDACSVTRTWHEWRQNANTVNLPYDLPDWNFSAAFGQFIEIESCDPRILPIHSEITAVTSAVRQVDLGDILIVGSGETGIEFIEDCVAGCDTTGVPKCSVPCGSEDSFPEITEPLCTTDNVFAFDCYDNPDYDFESNPNVPEYLSNTIIIAVTTCPDGSTIKYQVEDDGNLEEYNEGNGLIGFLGDENCVEVPIPECRPEGEYTGRTKCYQKKGKLVLIEKQFDETITGPQTVDVSASLGLAPGAVIATIDNALWTGGNSDIIATSIAEDATLSVSGSQPVCIKVVHGGAIPTDGGTDCFVSNDGVSYSFTGSITGDGSFTEGTSGCVTSVTDNIQGAINWTSDGPATSVTATTTNGNAFNSVRFFVATFEFVEIKEYVSEDGKYCAWFDGKEVVDLTEIEEVECEPIEVKDDCGSFTGSCMCYGANGGEDSYSYVNSDNETEGSFSMNTSTIKWQTGSGDGSLDGSIPYIDACISDGGEATITILDTEGNTVVFVADAFINAPGTTPTTAYSGTGPGGFSGKIREVTITCSTTSSEGGKACQWMSCDKTVVKWFDELVELDSTQVASLYECTIPTTVEPICDTDNIQLLACSIEDTGEVEEDDLILTIAKQDCEGVILSSVQYNVTQGNTEITEAVNTTDCNPEPSVTETEECLIDSLNVQWTEITIVQDTNISVLYVNESTQELGIPSGSAESWRQCPNESGLIDAEKACFEYFGQSYTGYSFEYSDGEIQYSFTDNANEAISGATPFCCDDCIEVFGCRDGRLAMPAGSFAYLDNGDSIDISGLRYSQVAQAIVDVAGGTYLAPSAGGPFGPNWSQCQGSSQHELQFTNLNIGITSIDEWTDYGQQGKCEAGASVGGTTEYCRKTYRVTYDNGAQYDTGSSCWGFLYRGTGCGTVTGWSMLNYNHPLYDGNFCVWQSEGGNNYLSGNEPIVLPQASLGDAFDDWAALWTTNDPLGNTWTHEIDTTGGIGCGDYIQTITSNPYAQNAYGTFRFRGRYWVYGEPVITVEDEEYFTKVVDSQGLITWVDENGEILSEAPENIEVCGASSVSADGGAASASVRFPSCITVCKDPIYERREVGCAIYDGVYVTLFEIVNVASNPISVVGEEWQNSLTGSTVNITDPLLMLECDGNEPMTDTDQACFICNDPTVCEAGCRLEIQTGYDTTNGGIGSGNEVELYVNYYINGEAQATAVDTSTGWTATDCNPKIINRSEDIESICYSIDSTDKFTGWRQFGFNDQGFVIATYIYDTDMSLVDSAFEVSCVESSDCKEYVVCGDVCLKTVQPKVVISVRPVKSVIKFTAVESKEVRALMEEEVATKDETTNLGELTQATLLCQYDCSGTILETFVFVNGGIMGTVDELEGFEIVSCPLPQEALPSYQPTGDPECYTTSTGDYVYCQLYTNENDVDDKITTYADQATGESISDTTGLGLTSCPPGTITVTEECYQATLDVKGLVTTCQEAVITCINNVPLNTTDCDTVIAGAVYSGATIDFTTSDWAACGTVECPKELIEVCYNTFRDPICVDTNNDGDPDLTGYVYTKIDNRTLTVDSQVFIATDGTTLTIFDQVECCE